jgi:hypothetical protein
VGATSSEIARSPGLSTATSDRTLYRRFLLFGRPPDDRDRRLGHAREEAIVHDQKRDLYMERAGYRVIRVWAGDVMADADEAARSVFDTAVGAPG